VIASGGFSLMQQPVLIACADHPSLMEKMTAARTRPMQMIKDRGTKCRRLMFISPHSTGCAILSRSIFDGIATFRAIPHELERKPA